MNLKFEQYKIFNAVAKEKSFSKAGEKLYMTQSAVSQAIKQLENNLGMVLFKRTPKGVELTEAGEILYKYTSSAIELLKRGTMRVNALKNLEEGELRIAASDTIALHFLASSLEEFHKMYPNIRIKVINRVSTESIELLKSGKADIAFVNLPIEDDSIEIVKCMKIQDTFVAGSNYKKDKNKIFSREDIAKLPLILLEKKSNSRRYVDKEFVESGQILNASIELGAHELLLKLASINLGVSCVIREFSKEYLERGDVFELKQKEPIKAREIGFCYSKMLPVTPTMQKFIKFLISGKEKNKQIH